MIKADRKKWSVFIFRRYISRLLKKHFSSFRIVGNPPIIPEETGLIITPNHISWWDGFFADYLISKKINRDTYLMMLEKELKKYPFFRKVGAYSITPDNRQDILESLRYSAEIVNKNENTIIVYPQGEIEDFNKRPLTIKNGFTKIGKLSGTDISILPIAFKIQYYNEKLPSILCRCGRVLKSSVIENDFSLFKTEFYENINLLNIAAINKDFKEDLFQ